MGFFFICKYQIRSDQLYDKKVYNADCTALRVKRETRILPIGEGFPNN